jgi:hypothetical protein
VFSLGENALVPVRYCDLFDVLEDASELELDVPDVPDALDVPDVVPDVPEDARCRVFNRLIF